MAQQKSIWRTVFWLIIIGIVIKFWLIWNGAVLLASVTRWFWWVMLIVAILILNKLYTLIFLGTVTVRAFITFWITWSVVILLIGFFANGITWTGTWQWSGSTTSSTVASVGTTSDGRTLLACQSNPNMPLEAIPAGTQAKMISTPYSLSPDGSTTVYDYDSTDFAVTQISLAKINGEDKTTYTAADLPEGDVFFRVWGDVGFATGKDFEIQVCSTDGKMLSREQLSTSPILRAGEDAATTSAITMYMWRNDRVWEPGTYQAYGYYTDGNGWKLIAKSPVFTITE